MAAVKPLTQTLLLFFLTAVAITSHAGKKEKPLTSVADLRYGVALYHYYQTDYMDALTELLLAKERGGIQGHGDNPALMEGGFALAYGLEKYAGGIFSEILAANVPEDAQVAAWFYLAKMRYMRGDWAMAQSSIAEVEAIAQQNKKSTGEINSDLNALRINLAIKQNHLASAEQILKKNKPGEDWLPYLYFNIGSLAAREGDFEKAVDYYKRVAEIEYDDDEYRSLHDKAMTAAGYAYLLNKQPDMARFKFSRVRLESPLSGRALLGYGWASAEQEDYRESLKVWQHLSQATLVDENSQEALMAVPYAYEKMGLEGLALQEFKKAVVGFQDEVGRIDNVIENLKGDTLLEALKIENADGVDWLTYAETNQLAPQLSYLIALFAREEFQMRVAVLRYLLAVQKNTREWQSKLRFYTEMLDARAQDRENKAAILSQDKLKNQLQEVQQQRDTLALKIESIAGNKDYFAMVTGDEADLVHRAKRAKKTLTLQSIRDDDPFIEDTDEAMRWYYGILLWNASEGFSDRLWRAVKTLNGLDETIDQLTANLASIEAILSSAPDLQPYRERIDDANILLDNQSASVDIAVDAAKEELRDQVVGVLIRQRNRIQHFSAQSRLSVARLYDKALKEQEAQAIQQEKAAEESAE